MQAITLADIRWDMILGGFGLFLFGIKFMGDGLKSVAGDKLRDYIDKYTSNPIMGVLVGALITILVQSSSATTAITIGLVRAGLMKLEQAAGVIFGANIGTTVTSFLISLSIDQYALYVVFLGGIVISFAKSKKFRYIGEIILGFGLLFYGLSIMGDSLKVLKDLPQFVQFAQAMSTNSILALLAGAIMTGIVQGSAATIGVVQKIYEAGGMTFMAVLPFVFGSNIGTTVTGILAALGGSLSAKRTAGLHTLFNVIGTIIAMVLLHPFANFIIYLSNTLNIPLMMQIAVAHIIFNVTTTLILLPFLGTLCKIIRKIIPGNEPEKIEINVDELETIQETAVPSVSLNVAEKAIIKMSTIVDHNVKETRNFFINKGQAEDKENLSQSESLINSLDNKITTYILKVSNMPHMTEKDMADMNLHLQVIKNLERIGDLSMNLAEFFEMVTEANEQFSKEAADDINQMFDMFLHMLNLSMEIYEKRDFHLYSVLLEDENYMDGLEYQARESHFKRMQANVCTNGVASSVYCDILGNLERMSDHCCNIGRCAITADGKIIDSLPKVEVTKE